MYLTSTNAKELYSRREAKRMRRQSRRAIDRTLRKLGRTVEPADRVQFYIRLAEYYEQQEVAARVLDDSWYVADLVRCWKLLDALADAEHARTGVDDRPPADWHELELHGRVWLDAIAHPGSRQCRVDAYTSLASLLASIDVLNGDAATLAARIAGDLEAVSTAITRRGTA